MWLTICEMLFNNSVNNYIVLSIKHWNHVSTWFCATPANLCLQLTVLNRKATRTDCCNFSKTMNKIDMFVLHFFGRGQINSPVFTFFLFKSIFILTTTTLFVSIEYVVFII